jgi:hypothetical protein
MPELAHVLAYASALLLALSLAIWALCLRGPLLQRLDGHRAANTAPAATVLRLLIAAFGVIAVAAVLAIIGWIFQ